METSSLGEFIKANRQGHGYGVRQLAGVAKVDPTWLSKVERGIYPNPDPRLLYRVARALDIEATDLYLAAGYGDTFGLPGFGAYLRSKYDLPPNAIEQLEAHFELINEKYENGGTS